MPERSPYVPSSTFVTMVMSVAILFSSKMQPVHMSDFSESPLSSWTYLCSGAPFTS